MRTWQQLKNDPNLWARYFIRETVYKAIRSFFEAEKFHEVETPLLIAHPPAESHLEIFETTLLDRGRNRKKAYLSTSPEVPLKKLLVAGIGNCYSLTKSFRNMETHSNVHNPEFTILEWYRVGVPYEKIMEDCERLIVAIYGKLLSHSPPKKEREQRFIMTYQGVEIDLTPPWERLSVKDAFTRYAHINFDRFFDHGEARSIARKKGYTVEEKSTWEQLYNQIFLNEVEPQLGKGKPTILFEFPGSMAALSKRKADDPRYAERFEFYIAGLELGDCYSELTDPSEQEQRFTEEMKEIKRLGKTTYDYDQDFIDALKAGLPPCSGIAVGIDRLLMLFADTTRIQETMYFPAEDLWTSR